jgi:hypothetical protein
MSFSSAFNTPAGMSAEQALRHWNVRYEKKPDGSLHVPGDISLAKYNLTELPDLSSVTVGGNFDCSHNHLTSLRGAPRSVGGDFACQSNRLASLSGAPSSVGGAFYCSYNKLASLRGAPESVGGDFWCQGNQLTSLKGVPSTVPGYLYCHTNPLSSLEGMPQAFERIESDFGAFACPEDVPPELRGKHEQQKAEAKEALAATTLAAPLTVSRPLSLKK